MKLVEYDAKNRELIFSALLRKYLQHVQNFLRKTLFIYKNALPLHG